MTQSNLKNSQSSSLLKDTRQAKGLTLEIVHEATKIPMDALRAIEEGYSTRILTPFYYRGFIKIYAEFLGLKVDEVLKEYNAQPAEIKTPVRKTIVATTKTPNILVEKLQDLFLGIWTPKNLKNFFKIIGAIIVIFLFFKMAGCAVNAIKSGFKNNSKSAAVSVKETKKQHSVKRDQPREDANNQEESSSNKVIAAQSQSHKVTLTVHASKTTWIQVKVDGKIAFETTMKKGTVENWEANDQIELSGKSIGDLDIEVNGRDVSPLSSSAGRHVRKVVINKDGLSVKK